MNLKTLDRICLTICIVCIVLGVTFGLTLIWGQRDSELVVKGLASCLVLFTGSIMTLLVSKTYSQKSLLKSSDEHDA